MKLLQGLWTLQDGEGEGTSGSKAEGQLKPQRPLKWRPQAPQRSFTRGGPLRVPPFPSWEWALGHPSLSLEGPEAPLDSGGGRALQPTPCFRIGRVFPLYKITHRLTYWGSCPHIAWYVSSFWQSLHELEYLRLVYNFAKWGKGGSDPSLRGQRGGGHLTKGSITLFHMPATYCPYHPITQSRSHPQSFFLSSPSKVDFKALEATEAAMRALPQLMRNQTSRRFRHNNDGGPSAAAATVPQQPTAAAPAPGLVVPQAPQPSGGAGSAAIPSGAPALGAMMGARPLTSSDPSGGSSVAPIDLAASIALVKSLTLDKAQVWAQSPS